MNLVFNYTPLFNTENLWDILDVECLETCSSGLFRPLEMMMLPSSEYVLESQLGNVSRLVYPRYCNKALYTLDTFLDHPTHFTLDEKPLDSQSLIERMRSFVGLGYVWGGNWVFQKPEELQKLLEPFSPRLKNNLAYLFSGLDCSGLLYAATFGQTPRNTSELVIYGQGLTIEGLSNLEILSQVRPLDLLVWKGHVLYFIDSKTLLESRHGFGVVEVDALSRLEEIRQTRQPHQIAQPDTFVIRRWIDSLS